MSYPTCSRGASFVGFSFSYIYASFIGRRVEQIFLHHPGETPASYFYYRLLLFISTTDFTHSLWLWQLPSAEMELFGFSVSPIVGWELSNKYVKQHPTIHLVSRFSWRCEPLCGFRLIKFTFWWIHFPGKGEAKAESEGRKAKPIIGTSNIILFTQHLLKFDFEMLPEA